MSITVSRPTYESVVHDIVRVHFQPHHHFTAASSGTKKAEQLEESFRRGVREGLAAILFVYRAEQLPLLKTLEPVYESDVHKILREYEVEFPHSTGEEKNNLLGEIFARLIDMALPEEMLELHEADRREKVLAGEVPPEPKDAEWLDGEMQKREDEARRLRVLRERARSPYVNDGPKSPATPDVGKLMECPEGCERPIGSKVMVTHLIQAHDYDTTAASATLLRLES